MLGTSANRHNWELSIHRTKYPNSKNCGKALFGDVIEARQGAVDSALISISRIWSKFRGLVVLVASRDLHLEAKSRLYSICGRGHSAMLYESETWPVKKIWPG